MLLKRLRRSRGAGVELGAEPTRRGLGGGLRRWLRRGRLDEGDWDELEEILIRADVGPQVALELVDELRQVVRDGGIREPRAARAALTERLLAALGTAERDFASGKPPQVVLMAGVNGAGKTTTIAKLAHFLRQNGYSVLLAAGDTYRAGAIEQLRIWGERVGVPVIAHQPGGDPGAVIYDAIDAATSRDIDYVIADSAGRLHTDASLMAELAKMQRVAARRIEGAPHEVLLVLDALTGQNGLLQAKGFTESVQISGIVMAKLDSSAKGGVIFAVTRELGVPVKFVGTGESVEDLAVFEPDRFVQAIVSADDAEEAVDA